MKVPGNFIPWSKSSREREFQGTKVPRYGTFAHVSESSYEWKLLLPIRIAVIFTMRRYALHGLCDHNSVRPSVCPSVTLVHCVRMVQPTIMIFSPYGSPIILVSGDITFIPKFEWGWARALNEGGVGTNWWFSTNKSPYVRNGARYDKGYY